MTNSRPDNARFFSSDQRLSGYGTLSGGLTLSKEFAKGLSLETGIEYYSHQGGLKLGSGGEDDFADYDYWVANAALKVDVAKLSQGRAVAGSGHVGHNHDANIPAGVLFGHMLDKAGDLMVGYRYQRSMQDRRFLHGDEAVNQAQTIAKGCPNALRDFGNGYQPNGGCVLLPQPMTMSMHMLDLMYAPTDWLTLMLMPQFMDMEMPLFQPDSLSIPSSGHGGHTAAHLQRIRRYRRYRSVWFGKAF